MSAGPKALLFGCLVLVLGTAGCPGFGSGTLMVDERPSWDTDVKQILADNCVFCHGETPQNGAPGGFRLDVFDANEAPDGRPGAFEMADRIRARAVNQDPAAMPPGSQGPPTDAQAVLDAWVTLGAPKTREEL